MIDLRYLALTLIGIFLALAIGLATGSALGGPDRRDKAYEGLRSQFELLRTDIQQARDEGDAARKRLEASDQALRELMPGVIRGRLAGIRVGIVLCGPVNEGPFWGDLERTLRDAGAEIGPVLRIPDRLRTPEPDLRMRMRRAFLHEPRGTGPDPYEPAAWMVRGLSTGGAEALLQEAARGTGMELRGDLSVPVRRFLLLTSPGDELRAASLAAEQVPELSFADAARGAGVRVVAAEAHGTGSSALDPLRRLVPSTVDGIDLALGQLSAILALAGADGNFGTRPGSSRPFPPLDAP